MCICLLMCVRVFSGGLSQQGSGSVCAHEQKEAGGRREGEAKEEGGGGAGRGGSDVARGDIVVGSPEE